MIPEALRAVRFKRLRAIGPAVGARLCAVKRKGLLYCRQLDNYNCSNKKKEKEKRTKVSYFIILV